MKKNKFVYYSSHFIKLKVPKKLTQKLGKRLLKQPCDKAEKERIDYYCKLNQKMALSAKATTIKDFKFMRPSSYFFDIKKWMRFFPEDYKFDYILGDVIHVPKYPSIVKSRPIGHHNACSVLLNLNHIRHFVFVNDTVNFTDKKDELVWRGNVMKNQKSRQLFLQKHAKTQKVNAGHVNDYDNNQWKTEKLSIKQQLQYKFILSIEGNDVATNLKWIMSSNSLCMMCKPKYETWFMEGRLIPDYHYVLIKEDYSDLEEKMAYYTQHKDKALEIIKNANDYVQQFQNKKREQKLALKVLEKYFRMTNQISRKQHK